MTHPVLELQAADTMADQLRHRRSTLVERDQVLAARNALVRWDQARTVARGRFDELATQVDDYESSGARIIKKRARLQAQMKTIISPKEAEALQHELAALDEQQRELDDVELEALEEQSRLDDELSRLAEQEVPLRDEYLAADAALSAAANDVDSEIEKVRERIETLRSDVTTKVLKRYDQLREKHLIAAATLSGSRCDGCHLDLSAAEIDTIKKDAADGGPAECPQCGRLLVI